MSVADMPRSLAAARPGIDLGWRNLVFSLRTALAALAALAIAFWLELDDPQWATLTVYLLAQPTVGAAVAKGAWRAAGTLAGGALGLVLVALFSQAAELLVAATALVVGASFYVGARLRNYTAYGVLLMGYTALLVAYEGASDPLNAWTIAADRIAAILLGIACVTAASTLVWPRFAGDSLREALAGLFAGLSAYGATALRRATPPAAFAEMRARMVTQVVSFDALRSYTLFEAPEMRADGPALARTVREFLYVLSIARGLYVRLGDFEEGAGRRVMAEVEPALAATAARLETIAADPDAFGDPRRVRQELFAARAGLTAAAERLAGAPRSVPFEPLANGLLILRRADSLLHELSMVIVAEAATLRPGGSARRRRSGEGLGGSRREATLNAARSALALAVLSAIWLATGWTAGLTAVTGGATMLFFAVNQDDPGPAARSFLLWSLLGTVMSYVLMILVLPSLEGFAALAVVLLLVLIPAGLMAGTPSQAWAGIAFGGFVIAQIGASNTPATNEFVFVNAAVAMVFGMLICLAILAVFPITSRMRRDLMWERTFRRIIPAVARGELGGRVAGRMIVGMLQTLLPRLALDREGDSVFFAGTLSVASAAVEIGRLASARRDRQTPPALAGRLDAFLTAFATAIEHMGGDRAAAARDAQALVAAARADLAVLWQGSDAGAARAVLHAGASLRYLFDRFDIDRAFLTRGPGEGDP
ncbi:FUSC family protein [Ancylobacter terrae]|uniref:FUSC family protein n=1 Tax=Ancylobacter sp. sgz301288 TaxID=3342077 RepID=UPI003858805A